MSSGVETTTLLLFINSRYAASRDALAASLSRPRQSCLALSSFSLHSKVSVYAPEFNISIFVTAQIFCGVDKNSAKRLTFPNPISNHNSLLINSSSTGCDSQYHVPKIVNIIFRGWSTGKDILRSSITSFQLV
ncbi:hypothetical protein ACH5RR_034238 [Cinchona calisaya]|uniref:Uncharacterized protein n=1 Tax=Cinchona calisaya TaxID=153742 RepID=A0ABD2YDC6_9GENT